MIRVPPLMLIICHRVSVCAFIDLLRVLPAQICNSPVELPVSMTLSVNAYLQHAVGVTAA